MQPVRGDAAPCSLTWNEIYNEFKEITRSNSRSSLLRPTAHCRALQPAGPPLGRVLAMLNPPGGQGQAGRD